MSAETTDTPPGDAAGAPGGVTSVSLHTSDGHVFAVLLPAVLPAHDEARRYMREGIGVTTGPDQETFYPPHSIVKITLDRRHIREA